MSEHELWNELGNLYFLSGSYGQAVHAYRRSIQLDDTFGRPYSNLALTYVQQGKFDQAVDLYRRSIELLVENNEKAISWNRLGNVLRYLKDYQSALVAYQKADELDPDNGETEDRPGWVSETATKAQPDPEADIIFGGGSQHESADLTAILADEGEARAFATDQSEIAPDDVVSSWAATDLSPYQEDLSTAPPPDPLTSWGTPSFEEDSDPFEQADQDSEVEMPDRDGDKLTRWLPVPEDVPQDMLADSDAASEALSEEDNPPIPEELPVIVPFVEAPAEEVNPIVSTPLLSPGQPSLPTLVPSIISYREITDQMTTTGASVETEVAVEVEERPGAEINLGVGETADLIEETVGSFEAPTPASPPPTEVATLKPAADVERKADETGKMESDIAKYRRVVQINPRNAHAWDTLGNLYKSAGQYPESLTSYQQAVATDPGRALYHHHLGLMYACVGRIEDAICSFQRVIEIDPGHSLAHATLGGYYRKMGLEELAQKHIGKAMKSIFDSENEYNRACLAAICGNADEALELLKVALTNKQTYVDWILRDPDLDFIRQDPRFHQLISDYTR